MPTRALTWAIFVAGAGIVAAVCVAILRPFANVIAWSAVLAILCYPRAIFGRSYAAEPEVLVKELGADEAIAAADTLLVTVPNTLGVDYNAHVNREVLKGCSSLIEVQDECDGLPSGDGDDLFRPLEQRGVDRTGLGLGLAFCRWAVEANHGTIDARSVPDKGCVFTVTLPRVVSHRSAQPVTPLVRSN